MSHFSFNDFGNMEHIRYCSFHKSYCFRNNELFKYLKNFNLKKWVYQFLFCKYPLNKINEN